MILPTWPRFRASMMIAVVLLLGYFPKTVLSQDKADDPLLYEHKIEEADEVMIDTLRAYYKSHAHVWLGREQRLANGVAWRLVTDAGSGVAAPRITWMSDRQSMLTANRLFEAIHGESLLENELEIREAANEDISRSPKPYQPTHQIEVVITYASPKLVSYVELGWANAFGSNLPRIMIGRVLDLEKGEVIGLEKCTDEPSSIQGAPFRLGDFLDVCDNKNYETFMALWTAKERHAIEAAAQSPDPYVDVCKEYLGPLDRSDRRIILYLTPGGLAVHNTFYDANIAHRCALKRSAINPVIIPYRELEPFMKPGPWRDELLGRKA